MDAVFGGLASGSKSQMEFKGAIIFSARNFAIPFLVRSPSSCMKWHSIV